LDPGDQGRARPLQLPAGDPGLPGAADVRGLLRRRLLEAIERGGRALGDDHRLPDGHLPDAGGHARDARSRWLRERLRLRLVLLDHQQHLLPVLQRADHDRLGDRNGRRQPGDRRSGLRAHQGPHVRHGDRGGPAEDARELGLGGGGGLGPHHAVHPGRVPVLPRLGEDSMRSQGSRFHLPVVLSLALAVSAGAQVPPAGFTSLSNGRDLSSWEVPAGDNGHWKVLDGVIDYDASSEATGDKALWTQKEYTDFALRLEWRIKETPYVNPNVPIIRFDGTHKKGPDGKEIKLQVPDSDSGVYLRGSSKSQINIWCWPIGSGEVYGYRTDEKMPPEVRQGVTPLRNADKDVGEWN